MELAGGLEVDSYALVPLKTMFKRDLRLGFLGLHGSCCVVVPPLACISTWVSGSYSRESLHSAEFHREAPSQTPLASSSSLRGRLAARYACFDIFGVDVMLDDHLQPFILEVNTGPNLWLDDTSTANQATIKGAFVPWPENIMLSPFF